MSDFLCPNCGPIDSDGDVDFSHDSEALFCALCGTEEDAMEPLVTAYSNLRQQLEQAQARVAELESIVNRVADVFGIGSEARTEGCILANVENTKRFSDYLRAVELRFLMVPGEPSKEYPDCEPDDECLVNSWGSTKDQYLNQFEAAILRKQAGAVESARDEICEFRGELWNSAQPEELTDYAQRLRQQADELEDK